MAFAIATVAVAAFSPMSAQALSDEADHLDSAGVALLDDAIDALSEGDDERYEFLLDQAFDGSVWLPLPTVIALGDREVGDIVAWSQILDGDSEEILDTAFDVIEHERDAAAERPRIAIEAIQLPISERVTASIGVSIGAASEVSDTIGRADGALYEAKRAGRNCVAAA